MGPSWVKVILVRALGIGPRTSVLSGQRSTTELRPQMRSKPHLDKPQNYRIIIAKLTLLRNIGSTKNLVKIRHIC